MAQPDHYVKTDCSTPDHPKVHALAEAMRCHEITALGALQALWCRAMRHCPGGDVTDVSDRTLRVWLFGFKPVSWASLVATGFVDEVNGRRLLHGWEERYASKEAMRRNNAERQRRARDKRVTSRVTGVTSNAAKGEEEGKEEEEGKGKGDDAGNVGNRSGFPTTAPSALPSPLFRIYRGKAARTNALRRSDELRTTLGERLAPYADRVAEVIAARAERAANPESYTTSAVRQSWVREIASAIEAADADERERAERAATAGAPVAPRTGGASALALDELLKLIPGGVS